MGKFAKGNKAAKGHDASTGGAKPKKFKQALKALLESYDEGDISSRDKALRNVKAALDERDVETQQISRVAWEATQFVLAHTDGPAPKHLIVTPVGISDLSPEELERAHGVLDKIYQA